MPETEQIWITSPFCCCRIDGRTWWTRLNEPVRLVAIIRSQSAGLERLQAAVPDIGAGVANQDVDRLQGGHDLVDDRLDRGPVGDVAGGDEGRVSARLRSSALARSSFSRSRPTRATRRPISASVVAMLRPIPLPAPVTSAVFKFAAKANLLPSCLPTQARSAPARDNASPAASTFDCTDTCNRRDDRGRSSTQSTQTRAAAMLRNKTAAAIVRSPRLMRRAVRSGVVGVANAKPLMRSRSEPGVLR